MTSLFPFMIIQILLSDDHEFRRVDYQLAHRKLASLWHPEEHLRPLK